MCIQAISFYHSIYHLITCSILYVCVHSVLIITHGPDYAWCLSIKTLTSEKEFVKSMWVKLTFGVGLDGSYETLPTQLQK